jgi:CheY-like chemotaxis protein
MKVLLVDDDDYRHQVFIKAYKAHILVRTYDYAQAQEYLGLSGPKFDLILLDHDLGEGPTGMAVAKLIAALPQEQRPEVVRVHSWNVDGARQIIAFLKDYAIPAYHQLFSVTEGEPGAEIP